MYSTDGSATITSAKGPHGEASQRPTTNRVPEVVPYINHAQVCVAPLRIARGIQNKVLEAMAVARPVVTTTGALMVRSLGESAVLRRSRPEALQHIVSDKHREPTVSIHGVEQADVGRDSASNLRKDPVDLIALEKSDAIPADSSGQILM